MSDDYTTSPFTPTTDVPAVSDGDVPDLSAFFGGSKYSPKSDDVIQWLRSLSEGWKSTYDYNSQKWSQNPPYTPTYASDPEAAKYGPLGYRDVKPPKGALGAPNQAILEWQIGLVKAGLIGAKTKLHPGLADPHTLGATQTLFRFMMTIGESDPKKALALLMQMGGAGMAFDGGSGGGGGAKGPKPQDKEFALDYGLASRMGWVK